MSVFYKISNGQLWDVQKGKYSTASPTDEVIVLYTDGMPAGEEYLIRTLRFYGYPLGELTEKCPDAILDQLKALDEKYLTPRALAGLATGDAYAAEQWEKHEAEAIPLRQKLAALEAAKV